MKMWLLLFFKIDGAAQLTKLKEFSVLFKSNGVGWFVGLFEMKVALNWLMHINSYFENWTKFSFWIEILNDLIWA